jgi:hypothetical protein
VKPAGLPPAINSLAVAGSTGGSQAGAACPPKERGENETLHQHAGAAQRSQSVQSVLCAKRCQAARDGAGAGALLHRCGVGAEGKVGLAALHLQAGLGGGNGGEAGWKASAFVRGYRLDLSLSERRSGVLRRRSRGSAVVSRRRNGGWSGARRRSLAACRCRRRPRGMAARSRAPRRCRWRTAPTGCTPP